MMDITIELGCNRGATLVGKHLWPRRAAWTSYLDSVNETSNLFQPPTYQEAGQEQAAGQTL